MDYDSLVAFIIAHESQIRSDPDPHPLFTAILRAIDRNERGEMHMGREYQKSNISLASDASQAGGLSHLTISAQVSKEGGKVTILQIRDISAGGITLNDSVLSRVLDVETELFLTAGEVGETKTDEIVSSSIEKKLVPFTVQTVPEALEVTAHAILSGRALVSPALREFALSPNAAKLWSSSLECLKDAVATLWARESFGHHNASYWYGNGIQKWRLREFVLRLLEDRLPG